MYTQHKELWYVYIYMYVYIYIYICIHTSCHSADWCVLNIECNSDKSIITVIIITVHHVILGNPRYEMPVTITGLMCSMSNSRYGMPATITGLLCCVSNSRYGMPATKPTFKIVNLVSS